MSPARPRGVVCGGFGYQMPDADFTGPLRKWRRWAKKQASREEAAERKRERQFKDRHDWASRPLGAK